MAEFTKAEADREAARLVEGYKPRRADDLSLAAARAKRHEQETKDQEAVTQPTDEAARLVAEYARGSI